MKENLDDIIVELIRQNRLNLDVPADWAEKQHLFHGLLNITPPCELSDDYYRKEKRYLQSLLAEKILTSADQISEKLADGIFLWKGDITTLAVDAIVNAANSALLGCFQPHHKCIDNAIHTAAGLALRNDCHRIMAAQGHEEKTGTARLTGGYNLPARYVLHTVGPIVERGLTNHHRKLLADCYRSCLEVADRQGDIRTLAFCSISTGVFRFPKQEAAAISLGVIRNYLLSNPGCFEKIIINVFTDEELDVYRTATAGY